MTEAHLKGSVREAIMPAPQAPTKSNPVQDNDSTSHESVKVQGGDNTTVDLVRHQPADCRIGQTIAGRYELQKLLGQGGFGTVYRGWDQLLERDVAVKLPHASSREDTLSEAHLREARLAAQLRHPGVVTVYDCGVDADDRTYVIFEFVPGKSLARIAAGRALEPAEAARLVAAIAEALHAAHRCGLVHRDLKPANILIDQDGRPRITDFGLAVDEKSQRQRRGEISGTPAYMAPEQLRGAVHHCDGRTDIWALGVLFYELLTGRRPFAGSALDEILEKPARPPRQLDETIPRELEACCLRCLNKRVEDRYPAAIDVAEFLQGWLAEQSGAEPTSRGPPPPQVAVTVEESGSGSRMLLPVPSPSIPRSVLGKVAITALTLAVLALGGWWWSSFLRHTDDPATSSAHVAPAVLAPNTWHDLLAEQPHTLITAGENPQLHWDAAQHTLAAAAGYPTLIQFGQTNEPNYQVRLTLRQRPWSGRVGLFCGGRDDSPLANQIEFQLLVLELNEPQSRDLVMHRMLVAHEQDGRQAPISRRRLARQDVPHPGLEAMVLVAEVRNGQLARVTVGDRDLDQLIDVPQAPRDPRAWSGPLGLYLDDSSVVVEKAEFRFTR
jgi:serine/threonine protein kinase